MRRTPTLNNGLPKHVISKIHHSQFFERKSGEVLMTRLFLTRGCVAAMLDVICCGIGLSVMLLVLCHQTRAHQTRDLDLGHPATEYQRAVAENPNSVEASLSLGLAYLSMGEIESASETFEKVLRFHPKSYEGHYWLGRTLYLQEKYQQAITTFQTAIGLLPEWGEAYADLGLSYFRLHQYEAAEAAFLNALSLGTKAYTPSERLIPSSIALKIDPQWIDKIAPLSQAEIYYYLSLVAFERGLLDEAAKYCRQTIHIEPSAQAFFQLGLVFVRQKRLQAAEEAFLNAIRQNTFLLQAHYQLALLYFKQGKEMEAEKEMETFRQLKEAGEQSEPDVNKAPALVSLGWFYLNEKKYEEAVREYQKAIWHNPDLAPAYNGLGHAYAMLERYEEARQVLMKALKLNPQMAEIHAGLGFILLKGAQASESEPDYELALSAYRQATVLNPDFPEALLNQGNIALKLSQLDEAKKAYETLLSLYSSPTPRSQVEIGVSQAPKPNLTRVHLALGKIYLRQKESSTAIRHYQQALKSDPDLVEAYYNMALIAVREGRLDEAVEYYEAVLQRKPNMAEAHYLVGKIYTEQKQYEKAESAYQRAIEIMPSFADAYERLAYLYGIWGRHLDEALELSKKAVELQPNSAVYLNTLSWLYYLDKDYVRAFEAIKKASMLQPGNPLYQEGLKVIQRAQKNEQSSR